MLVSWGVSYRVAMDAAVVKPFTQETGIQVSVIDTPDLAKVKAQQMTGNIEWDVFDAPARWARTVPICSLVASAGIQRRQTAS